MFGIEGLTVFPAFMIVLTIVVFIASIFLDRNIDRHQKEIDRRKAEKAEREAV